MNERADVHFIDLEFLGNSGVIGTGVLRTGGGIWLVDPGPSTGLPGLEKGLAALGLSLADVRGLLLTHIHLDHAGASGTIIRQHPDVRAFVHERGAPHLVDPSRLLESAGRLYAGNLERLWGEVAPVPFGNLQVLTGGEHLDLDGRRVDVAYTPGHASHHVSFLDTHTGFAFVGDTGGVRFAPTPHVVPPTPPPDINLPLWEESIARLRAWNATRLFVTHFGGVDEPGDHFEHLQRSLWSFADLVYAGLQEPGSDDERMSRFVERVTADLMQSMPEEEAARYQLAVSPQHCWLGLARYWRKQGRQDRSDR